MKSLRVSSKLREFRKKQRALFSAARAFAALYKVQANGGRLMPTPEEREEAEDDIADAAIEFTIAALEYGAETIQESDK